MKRDIDKKAWLIAKIEEAYRLGWEADYQFYQKQYQQEFGGKYYEVDEEGTLNFYE